MRCCRLSRAAGLPVSWALLWTSLILSELAVPSLLKAADPREPDPQYIPRPKILISEETTYITGPLTESGVPDYVTALNRRLGEGVTPENNAAVLLWRAIGPRPEGDDREFGHKVADALGMDRLPEEGDYFIPPKDFFRAELLRRSPTVSEGDLETQIEELTTAIRTLSSTPWEASEHPLVAAWVEANEKPLELVREAVTRPRYYRPVIDPRTNPERKYRLLDTYYSDLRVLLEIGDCLNVRATQQGVFRDPIGNLEDVLTNFQMARHMARGWSLLETLIALKLEQRTALTTTSLLVPSQLPVNELRDFRRRFENLGPLQTREELAENIGYGERMMAIDCSVAIATREILFQDLDDVGNDRWEELNSSMLWWVFAIGLDWNRSLGVVNSYFNQAETALRDKNFKRRQRRLQDLEDRFDVEATDFTENGFVHERRAEQFGTILVANLFPAIRGTDNAFLRGQTAFRLTLITAALTEYRSANERYPDSLDALSPHVLKKIPNDPFADAPFHYKVSEEGQSMMVYSVSYNGLDEGGLTYGESNIDGVEPDDIRVSDGLLPAGADSESQSTQND